MKLYLYPDADDTDSNWLNNLNNNTDLYSYIDDPHDNPDDATTCIHLYSATYATGDAYFGVQNHGAITGTIQNVRLATRGYRTGGAGFCSYTPSIRIGSTNYGASPQVPDSWATFNQDWDVNPVDSESWEWADIDGIKIRLFGYASFGYYMYVTQAFLEIDYVPFFGPFPTHLNI